MNKPAIKREKIDELLRLRGVNLAREKVVLVGIRGYFRDSMGKKGKNDIGIFDDGFAWIDPTDFATFNGNTDPASYYQRVATLKLGAWRYKPGNHGSAVYGPYPAFRQAAPVTVLRYDSSKGAPAIPDTGMFGINIHHGSKTGGKVSSIGCQTIPYEQWAAFKAFGDMLVKRHKVKDFLYLLVENDGSIA
jgi:hypothetical protein